MRAGPFQPTWESLAPNYQCPEWFRDAKFGIWAHWSAQCVPEEGDWYARNMYIQGTKDYDYHVAHYGHPSKFGFMEIDNLWKAEKWDPEKLMALYKRAGAKYFVALANHHDNFDAYDSKYQPWNSVNVGPKKDIVGTWAKIARANGLRFGVSNHSSHAWHWFQAAYGHESRARLPACLTTPPRSRRPMARASGGRASTRRNSIAGCASRCRTISRPPRWREDWHRKIDGNWYEIVPPNDNGYAEKWFLRCQDLVDKYQPDLLYFDDTELPFGQTGLDIAAHLYNAKPPATAGSCEAVLNSKGLQPAHAAAMVPDIERGVAEGIRPSPGRPTPASVRGITSASSSRSTNTRPWGRSFACSSTSSARTAISFSACPCAATAPSTRTKWRFSVAWRNGWTSTARRSSPRARGSIYGEGPSVAEKAESGEFGGARDVRSKPYTAEDVRFTRKGNVLYAVLLDWPSNGAVVVSSLGTGTAERPALLTQKIASVALLGSTDKIGWSRDAGGLHATLPARRPGNDAFTLKLVLE